MINFIKQAVESVEGIKSFLFNTDYRNNFDLQNVEFPCCVLTPIMRTNYDLNNIIRESAELQLSVVDLAPYEYTGDDLYEINKRCSDLALQVIANLQVKSKLEKELTFEFILPSGDELISGVMCNLTATMKQGSCIGKPSYVEVIVQPIKKESITRNGKHVISPSSGFNAMKDVEVDVNIDIPTIEEKSVDITRNGEVEILPTSADAMTKVTANVQVPPPPLEEKQVTITKANAIEIITPDSEYGLSRVEVSTDIPLESKQITITENGTTTIEASEGFEGIESVEVVSQFNTLNAYINQLSKGLDRAIERGHLNQNEKQEILDFFIQRGGGSNYELWDDVFVEGINSDVNGKFGVACLLVGDYLAQLNIQADVIIAIAPNVGNSYEYAFPCFLFKTKGSILKYGYTSPLISPNYLLEKVIGSFTFVQNQNLQYWLGYTNLEEAPTFIVNGYNIFSMSNFAFQNKGIKRLIQRDWVFEYCTFVNAFSGCVNLEEVDLNAGKITSLSNTFRSCYKLRVVRDFDLENNTSLVNAFTQCYALEILRLTNWGKYDISTKDSDNLSPESIHYIIQNAVDVADGATARTLTLHATAKTNWQNSEYYEQDLAVLSIKGITIA